MKLSKINLVKFGIYIVLIISSIYAINLCSSDISRPSGYEKLFLLPLSFLICIVLFYFTLFRNQSILENMPCFLMMVLTFLRNVFTPIKMVTDSYVSSLGIASADSAKKAIWLVFYETLVIYIFVFIVEKYRFKQKGITLPVGKENRQIFKVLCMAMLGISVLALLIVPVMRTHYYSIFTAGYTGVVQDVSSYRGNALTRILGTAGDMTIAAVRYVFPCYLFYKLASKGQTIVHIAVSIMVVLLQSLFMTDSNAFIFMLMISQMLFIVKLYPKYQKGILVGLSFMVVVLGLFLYFNRFALDHYSKSISLWLQSYIPGVANTAGVMNINPEHQLGQIFKDIWVAIPFKSFLGYSGNVSSLAQIWGEVNNCRNQIMSTVGQSYYYFGALFSPLLSCVLIQISRKCQKRIYDVDNALLSAAYIYLMIYSIATPFIYNLCIYLHALLQRIIFIFILAYFAPCRLSDIDSAQK